MAVYLDTGALIALYERRDDHHADAKRRLSSIRERGELLVTGWHTITEFIDGLCHHYGQPQAAEELAKLRDTPSLRIVKTEERRDEAVSILQDRTGWAIDLSDAFSFAVMSEEDIDTAFTYDDDFEKAGFEVVG